MSVRDRVADPGVLVGSGSGCFGRFRRFGIFCFKFGPGPWFYKSSDPDQGFRKTSDTDQVFRKILESS
mgnify:CR=1 FL=1